MADDEIIDGRAEIMALNAYLLSETEPDFERDELLILRIETTRRDVAQARRQMRRSPLESEEVPGPEPEMTIEVPVMTPAMEARLELEKGAFDTAAILFERLADAEPGNADAWIGLAQARFALGNLEGCSEAVREIFHLRPTSNKGFMIRSRIHRAHGNIEGARQDLWRLVAKNLTETPILLDVLREFQGMGLAVDVGLVAGAILDVDVDNAEARLARQALVEQS